MLGPKFPETDPEKATVLMGDYNTFDILYFSVYKKLSTYQKKKNCTCVCKSSNTYRRTDVMCICCTINKEK